MAPENRTVLFSRTVLIVPSRSIFKSAEISKRPKLEVLRLAPTHMFVSLRQECVPKIIRIIATHSGSRSGISPFRRASA